jgi:subtilisin family serine protease
VLCVGAIGPDGKLAAWDGSSSSIGAQSVDVLAPGSMIAVSDGGGGFSVASGTSYACAFASGIAGLYLASYPGHGASEVVDAIRAAARRPAPVAGLCRSGLLTYPATD